MVRDSKCGKNNLLLISREDFRKQKCTWKKNERNQHKNRAEGRENLTSV